VKGSEKNDPDLRKGILGKSLRPFLLFLFHSLKTRNEKVLYFLKKQLKLFKNM
jgi:hypothetical protein